MHDLLGLLEDVIQCPNTGWWVIFGDVILTGMHGPDTFSLSGHSLPSKHIELMTIFSRLEWAAIPSGHSLHSRK